MVDLSGDRRSGTAGLVAALAALAALAMLAGCGGEGGNGSAEMRDAANAAEGEPAILNEDEGAALADEAAADEAADMDLYGGNAAAGETGNAAFSGAVSGNLN